MPLDLPQPDKVTLEQSKKLQALIVQHIAEKGPISLSQYLNYCLYQPGLGYYSAGATKFGSGGDFITAPELGYQFAHCVADYLLSLPQREVILELGAGSGAMAADLLLRLEALNELPERYLILDRSADLQQRQKETLGTRCPHLINRVEWLITPPQKSWKGTLIGNEVVDALAAERVIKTPSGWQLLKIDLRNNQLDWVAVESPGVNDYMQKIESVLEYSLEPGYVTEFQPMLPAWLASITANLSEGNLLLADYGYLQHEYYHPQRDQGTLIAHYQHRALNDIFLWPGLVDISVSVDFSALAMALESLGWTAVEISNQADFLLQHGLAQRLQNHSGDDDIDHLKQIQEFKLLTLPSEMGERFKVISASRH